MNRTNRFRNLMIALILVLLGSLMPMNQIQAQERILTDEQLIQRAIAYYEDYDFLRSAMYLQAYIQRNPAPMRNSSDHAEQVKAALDYSVNAVTLAMTCREKDPQKCGLDEEGLVASIGFGLRDSLPFLEQPPSSSFEDRSSTTTPSGTSTTGQSSTATVLFDGSPNSNRRKVNATFCSGFDSECNFGNCPKNYKLVWGPYCRASDHPYIQPGRYRVILSGTGTVTAGATDYGTFFDLYGLGQHTFTLPGSYTFCWPGRAPGGYGFETIVQAGSTSDQITNIRIEYLGSC
jgi:hypothetical protein